MTPNELLELTAYQPLGLQYGAYSPYLAALGQTPVAGLTAAAQHGVIRKHEIEEHQIIRAQSDSFICEF